MADKEQELTEELEAARDETERLKQEKEAMAGELESKDATITELEQTVAGHESEILTLKETIVASDRKLTDINANLSQAVAGYKALVAAANPEIPADMITGETVEAINESLEGARALVDRVRQGIEAEVSRVKIPAGAPQRAPLDLSVLSPREKIQYAIGGKR